MAEVIPLVRPSLAATVSRAAEVSLRQRLFRAVCWAEGTDQCGCRRPSDCTFDNATDQVDRTLSALADVLAGDDALAREIGRDAVSAVCRRLWEGM